MEHDVVSLTEDFQYINKLNYKKLPVVLEEAVILYRSQGKNNEFFNRIRVSEPTAQRFREFAKLTSAAKGDREKAKQATQAFKNTYWYYVLFISPKVTNLKLDTKPVEANY
jgi:transglutaminase-like putative cysteine protease